LARKGQPAAAVAEGSAGSTHSRGRRIAGPAQACGQERHSPSRGRRAGSALRSIVKAAAEQGRGKNSPCPFFSFFEFLHLRLWGGQSGLTETRLVRAGGLGPPATEGSARVAHYKNHQGFTSQSCSQTRRKKKGSGEFFPGLALPRLPFPLANPINAGPCRSRAVQQNGAARKDWRPASAAP
jgi:hypothetical protein